MSTTETQTLTNKQRHILHHTLGAGSTNPGYRNYFAADPGSPDHEVILALVDFGLMRPRGNQPNWIGGLLIYHVTDTGQDLVGVKYKP